MRKLWTFNLHERPLAPLLRERLEKEGIACLIRNEELFVAIGEIPLVECFPQLWIVDDEVYPRAKSLLENWLRAEPSAPWTCPGCGERHEGQFGGCWKCGRERES